jgi:hypothetical protein
VSKYFNTGEDRISPEQMRVFAGRLSGKPSIDCTPRELMAAVPAIRSYRNGAPLARCREVFQQRLNELEQVMG